jgi:hypothetical protein
VTLSKEHLVASTPIAESVTADHGADVVVCLIGMRINRWRSVRYWAPVLLAFLPMIRELLEEPASGCRSAQTFWSGRTILTVQYWDSVEQLISYAHDPQARHRPAWRAYNRNAGKSTAVGIFHETYSVQSGHYETIYRAMPPSGLAAATDSVAPIARRGVTARARLAAGERRSALDRAAADRLPVDRATADRVTADRVAANRVTADRVTADRATAVPLSCPHAPSAVLADPVLAHPLFDAQRGLDHIHDLGLDLASQERDADLDLARHQLGRALRLR